jgi:hypothetical protein
MESRGASKIIPYSARFSLRARLSRPASKAQLSGAGKPL